MEFRDIKQKSFLYTFGWVGFIFIAMGILFASVGIFMQLMTINGDNFHMTVNGVVQPYNEENERIFRLIFLLAFGGVGVLLMTIGGIFIGRARYKKRVTRRLKEEGLRLLADVVEYSPSVVRVNNHRTMRLVCSHTTSAGDHYLFKSGLLRRNPDPYLADGQVTVYYERDNLKHYFVDVDGSVGNVFEV